jgi:hypothetical protein
LQLAALSTEVSILGRGNGSFLQVLFRSMKSMHILIFLFFFGTSTTLASHSEYLTSLMAFASNGLCTSAFAANILSSDIFLYRCFFGFIFGLISRECCMISLLAPFRSEDDQTKTSLFLAKVSMSSASFSFERLSSMVTFLSNTAFSNETNFVSS